MYCFYLTGGARSNCYRFIAWVTGCSPSTIGKVNEQMRQTNGRREPPTHGMKRYWQNKPKTKTREIEQPPGQNTQVIHTVSAPVQNTLKWHM